jgi:hypothetical protein
MGELRCAPCYGLSGKGTAPAAAGLKTPWADPTLLASNHGGKFPMGRVGDVHCKGISSVFHGKRHTPVWGPLSRSRNPSASEIIDQRNKNLPTYIEIPQAKQ